MHDVVIIGAGPIGMTCAIEARNRNYQALIIEKGCLVNSIYHYPTHMRFFSTPDLLEIGSIPFICRDMKPTRLEALEYYRRVAGYFGLNIHQYETVRSVEGNEGAFSIQSDKGHYEARAVIAAVGFFDRPRMLNVPGEELAKVQHYYQEPHPYAGQNVLIVGSGNSAVIAALECYRYGAKVSLAIRGEKIHEGVKYWLLPDIENRIRDHQITAWFNTHVREIQSESVILENAEGYFEIENNFVLAMTGYEPDFQFLRQIGVQIGEDALCTPCHNHQTYETNRPGLYLAGVVVGGMRTNEWFIENSRIHAQHIFDHLEAKKLRLASGDQAHSGGIG